MKGVTNRITRLERTQDAVNMFSSSAEVRVAKLAADRHTRVTASTKIDVMTAPTSYSADIAATLVASAMVAMARRM